MAKALMHQIRGTRLLLTAGALFLVVLTSPASAGFGQETNETAQLLARINQLENQVQTLSRAVWRGGKAPDSSAIESSALSSGGGGAGSAAVFETRMSDIEQQQRTLTGQLEQITYQVRQI